MLCFIFLPLTRSSYSLLATMLSFLIRNIFELYLLAEKLPRGHDIYIVVAENQLSASFVSANR